MRLVILSFVIIGQVLSIRKMALVFLFLMTPIVYSHAYMFEPEVTNWSDSTENAPDLGFFPLHRGYSPVSSIAQGYYAWGTAFEFNLEQEMLIHSIMSPVAVSRGIINHTPVPGTWKMNLTLFSGTTNISHGQVLPGGQVVPIKNPVFSQDFTAHGHDLIPIGSPQGRVYTFQGVKDMNLVLTPGKYWATYYDGGVVTYVQPRVRLDAEVTTPEPSTMFLLGGGLAGMLWRRRNRKNV